MSLLTREHVSGSSLGNDWLASDGWVEARCVGVADIGEMPNKYQDGKMKAKISVLFALDEYIDKDGEQVQKTSIQRYTASLHEKSGLVTKILGPAGLADDLPLVDGHTRTDEQRRAFLNVEEAVGGRLPLAGRHHGPNTAV